MHVKGIKLTSFKTLKQQERFYYNDTRAPPAAHDICSEKHEYTTSGTRRL